MSSGKRKVLTGALLALAMMSGCTLPQSKYTMTPEEVQLYHLQLQKSQAAAEAYNKTPEGKAEIRRRFEHDAQWQADQQAAEGAEIQKRMSPNYRPPAPPEQHMCSVNYGSTVGLVPCP
ncbi:hypothetical protein PQQ86_13845 [Paraburkholderia sediminicola]|uniref:hypothetical protein n=1 Tax=Paraburkholderia sediminicola TaxID=458836 RepID=UPI0038BA8377